MENKIKYKSKVDWWLGVLILLLFVMGVGSIFAGVMIVAKAESGALWFIVSGVFMVGLILGVAWPVYYVLGSDSLLISHGLIKSRLKYEKIKSIAPSRNPLSSPALSLDRLQITYSGKIGFLLVSPKDKNTFMKDLAEKAGHLEFIDGEVRSVKD